MLNEETLEQNMDIVWECRKQGCWIALEAYRIVNRINTLNME